MLKAIKNNIYPAVALMILPVGYYIGTELRERNDAEKLIAAQESNEQVVADPEQVEKLRQQLEALREEREMVLSKIHQQKPE